MEWDQTPVFRKEFVVTLEDAVQTQKLLALQRMSPRFPYLVALVLWTIASAFSYVRIGENDHRVLVALIMNLPVPVLIFALLKWLPPLAWRSNLRMFYGPGPYSAQVRIGETQLIYGFDDLEQRFAWRAAEKLQHHSDELRVFFGKFALVRIPARVFDRESEKREWMDALEQKTGLSFS